MYLAYYGPMSNLSPRIMISRARLDKICKVHRRMLENKLQEAKQKKDTLKARAKSANASKQVSDMMQVGRPSWTRYPGPTQPPVAYPPIT